MTARIERSWNWIVAEDVVALAKKTLKRTSGNILTVFVEPWCDSKTTGILIGGPKPLRHGLYLRRNAHGVYEHTAIVAVLSREDGHEPCIQVIYGTGTSMWAGLAKREEPMAVVRMEPTTRGRKKAVREAAKLLVNVLKFGHPTPDVIQKIGAAGG